MTRAPSWLLSSAGPSWWWLGSSSLWTRRLSSQPCGRWAQGGGVATAATLGENKADGRGRDAGEQKHHRPPAAHGSRLASSNWHLDLQPHGCTLPPCPVAPLEPSSGNDLAPDRIRGNGSQRSNGHGRGRSIGGFERAGARLRGRIVAKRPAFRQSPRPPEGSTLRAVSAPLVREIGVPLAADRLQSALECHF